MKKLFALLLALALTLGACTVAVAEEPVTITFWHTYGDAETPVINDVIIPMFEAANPGIKVEAIRQSGDFNQMLVTALGTGMVPDVARVDITKTSAYAKLGGIVAMDEIEGFAALKDAVLEGPLSTNLWNGHYYGLPLNTNCKAAVVNLNVLKTLGFDAAPATMEEFVAACKEKAAGQYKLNVSGLGDWDLFPYFWLFGGVVTDEGFTKASGYMDSAESVAAINTMLQLHQDGVFTIRDVDGTADAWAGINDEYAMFFEGPWAPFNEENGTSLVNAGYVHYEPFGLYAGKSSDLENIADGAKIAVPNDTTNEARALLLLQQEGLITLADGAGVTATTKDIVDNPKNLEIVELEAAQVSHSLQDVDFGIINGNYALEAGLSVADALAVESAEGVAAEQYGNIIAVADGNQDSEKIKALVAACQSDEVAKYIEDTYNGAVVPLTLS